MNFLPRPDCTGFRANDKNWESGTAERSGGRTNERERFFGSVSVSDDVFGIVEVEPDSVVRLDWLEEEGFSSTADDE
jgi:hypothetical protein